jgi:membrane fusion protein (multidrug efflux system)
VQLDTSVEVADLASAIATQREAEVAYERQADLMQKRVTSEANLDTARAKRETAQAAVKRIQAVIAQKGIVSPFGGRLGIRKVEKGQYVSAGLALVSLQALNPSASTSRCPSSDRQAAGGTVDRADRSDAFPNQVFGGQIQSLDARVAQDTRTLLVRGCCPIRSASCCRACSPTSPCWWARPPM